MICRVYTTYHLIRIDFFFIKNWCLNKNAKKIFHLAEKKPQNNLAMKDIVVIVVVVVISVSWKVTVFTLACNIHVQLISTLSDLYMQIIKTSVDRKKQNQRQNEMVCIKKKPEKNKMKNNVERNSEKDDVYSISATQCWFSIIRLS